MSVGCDVIDLRTTSPLDEEAVLEALRQPLEERQVIDEWAERLSAGQVHRLWQLLLKGLIIVCTVLVQERNLAHLVARWAYDRGVRDHGRDLGSLRL